MSLPLNSEGHDGQYGGVDQRFIDNHLYIAGSLDIWILGNLLNY